MQSTNDRASARKEAARQHLVIFRRKLDERARYYVELADQYGLTADEVVDASGLSEVTVGRLLSGDDRAIKDDPTRSTNGLPWIANPRK